MSKKLRAKLVRHQELSDADLLERRSGRKVTSAPKLQSENLTQAQKD